jgi:Fe-S-cluster-containing dehydrogenase component
MANKYTFILDMERCTGCYACEIACEQWHGIKAGTIKYRRVEERVAGTFPEVKIDYRTIACLHCSRPNCVQCCPEKAISKRQEDGIVIVDKEKCTGCRACYDACPVHAPQFSADGTMQKCDMCLEEVIDGRIPVCAATCPTKALRWGTIESLMPKPQQNIEI